MTMKRFCATALLLLWSLCALAVQKSGTIVYINGSKFYVHTVQPGETLYGLSKAYEVGEKVILQHNPAAAQGLRAGESIKIPFVSDVPQPKSERKLRKTFDIHTVTQGETLYGISRKYEIPIQTVIEDLSLIHISPSSWPRRSPRRRPKHNICRRAAPSRRAAPATSSGWKRCSRPGAS